MDPMFLKGLWYFALPGRTLKPGRMTAKMMLGEPLLIGRGRDGIPFAVRDICLHRGMPLSSGRFDGTEIECCYHGWRYDTAGRCTDIPSLSKDQAFDFTKIRLRNYRCREVQGNIWVYMGEEGDDPLPPVPEIPDIGDQHAQIAGTMVFPCNVDHAALGLIDSAHGPYVHRSWFWRTPKGTRDKVRKFVPSHLGFTMVRHVASSNSWIFRPFGGTPQMEITFQLPGVHIEHARVGRYLLCGMIVVTPISESETEVNYQIFWTIPWLTPFRPILKPFVHTFFGQDRQAMIKLRKGLDNNPPQLFVSDPDEQAKWYYRLKKEFARAREENRPFENPIKEQVLRWRT